MWELEVWRGIFGNRLDCLGDQRKRTKKMWMLIRTELPDPQRISFLTVDRRKICERGLSLLSWHGRLMELAEHVLRNPAVLCCPMGGMPLNSAPTHSACGFCSLQMLRDNFYQSFSTSVTLWPASKAWHHFLLSSTFVLLSLWSFLPPFPSLPLSPGARCPWIKARLGLKW